MYGTTGSDPPTVINNMGASSRARESSLGLSMFMNVVYPIRWFVLLTYCLTSIANAITWLTYSPIAVNTAAKYKVSLTWVNWLSMSFMLIYIPIAPVASWVLEKYGLRTAVLSACVLQTIGAAVRIAGTDPSKFYLVLIGQALCAVAQPFVLAAPAKLSCVWFAEDQRALATAIATVANAVGAGVGFLIPPLCLGPNEDLDNFFWVHVVEAAIMGGNLLFALIFMRAQPETPASPTSITGNENFSFEQYLSDLGKLLRDWNFLCLFFCFSVGNGVFNALGTLINQFIKPFNYSDSDTGNIGAVFIVAGVVGAGIGGYVADVTHKHKVVLSTCFFLGALCMVGWLETLVPNNVVMLMLSTGAVGFVQMPAMPLNIELAASYVYPIGESTVSSILQGGGQIVGIVSVLIMTPLVEDGGYHLKYCVWAMACASLVASLVMFTFQGTLTRKEVEGGQSPIDEGPRESSHMTFFSSFKLQHLLSPSSATRQSQHSARHTPPPSSKRIISPVPEPTEVH